MEKNLKRDDFIKEVKNICSNKTNNCLISIPSKKAPEIMNLLNEKHADDYVITTPDVEIANLLACEKMQSLIDRVPDKEFINVDPVRFVNAAIDTVSQNILFEDEFNTMVANEVNDIIVVSTANC